MSNMDGGQAQMYWLQQPYTYSWAPVNMLVSHLIILITPISDWGLTRDANIESFKSLHCTRHNKYISVSTELEPTKFVATVEP
jgi:hypothetical protein